MTQFRYDTSPEFQARIVASILRDDAFFKAYYACIEAKFFVQDTHQKLVAVAVQFFTTYAKLPDQVELMHNIQQHLKQEIRNTNYLQEVIPVYKRDIDELYAIPTELLKSAQVYAIEFARAAGLKLALLESAQSLDGPGALEKAQARISKAALIGMNVNEFGIDYFKTAKERHMKRLSQSYETMRIPFLIPKLDIMLGGVGYRENGGVPEMCVFLAPTNRGKSRALCHVAKVGATLSKNVVIFTAEMAAELYAERLDMSISNLTTKELYQPENTPGFERRIELYRQQGGRVLIQKYPSRSTTIAQTVSYLHTAKNVLDFKPDIVIYDYIDEFLPPSGAKDERRHELSAITSAMRAVCDEFGCAVYTATQGNREALTREVVDLRHIAEDIGKANIADIIISLCQTEAEAAKQPPEQRWLVCKNRSGAKGMIVRVQDDAMRMKFSPHPEDKLEDHELAITEAPEPL